MQGFKNKVAITQFTRSLAVELAPRNILANTIAPGFVRTSMSIKEAGGDELASEWFVENFILSMIICRSKERQRLLKLPGLSGFLPDLMRVKSRGLCLLWMED